MILIKNARVLTMDDQYTEYDRADILIEGTQIKAIGPNLEVQAGAADVRIIDGANHLAMPGLVNGHIHSPGNFMKGALDGYPLEIFMLYEVPPLSDTPPSARMNYVRTMLGNIEMLKLGITAVHDDAFHVPVPTEQSIDGLMQAYVDSGMRAVVTIDQPNVVEYDKYPYLYDLLPDDLRKSMAEAPRMNARQLLDCYDYQIKRWHNNGNGRVRSGVSISAPQRVTLDYFEALSCLSKELDVPFDIHILETKLQRVLGQEKYGKSLVKYVHDLGFLEEHVMVIHSIWVDDEDVQLMKDAKVSIAHNPLCNLRLGSGVMTWRRMLDAGIPLCMGTDEGCTDDTANMWMVGKTAGLIHNLEDPDYNKWPKAKEIVWAMTRGGAHAMRNEGKVGSLAAGQQADLILLDLNSIAFTPLNDIYRQLVYCENGSSVTLTMVAGQVVMENGKVLTVDEEQIKAEVRELMPFYKKEIEKTNLAASKLEPYYRQMYLRCAAADVGMNRWAGEAWKELGGK
ncbi:MAG: amidohydrolase family protein [Anaerolineaceae bacterium]|nr:amidohydrolase family protein [Anaerolineaceae bacterium]